MRIGHGYDLHALAAGRRLVLGGVEIAHDRGPIAHSDGDVLLHALADALLGAAALGDIGELFPDTDPANRGRDSAEMLVAACERVQQAGYTIVNLDCMIHAQRPKLSPFKPTIRNRVASILGIEPDRVSIKAKTGEHVGPVGMEEAIQAQCIALIGARGAGPGARE